jgi:AcrR family transcriptional regulator
LIAKRKRQKINDIGDRSVTVSARKMSKNPARAEQYREQLYEGVAQVLLKRRKGTFTLDEVAAEIGVSKGVIYYYFESKGELIYRLNKYMFDLIRDAVTPIYNDASLSPRQKLYAMIKSYMDIVIKRWKVSRLLWSDMSLRETSAPHAGVINRERKAYRKLIARIVREIIIAEHLEPVDEHIAAWFIYGNLSFASMWFRPGRELTQEEISYYIIRLITGGLLGKKSAR